MSKKEKKKKEKFSMTFLQKATLLFFIGSVIYFVLPTDVLPFTIFDDLAILVVAAVIWILSLIIPTSPKRR